MSDQAASIFTEGDRDDADVDAVLGAFDGDARAAIRSLLIANEFLNAELDRLRAGLSVGYVRGGNRP